MNFGVNKGILIAGFVIVVLSIGNQWFITNKPQGITKILVGAYIAMLVLAFADMIPGLQPVTTGLAMLAMLTTIFLYGGQLFGLFAGAARATGAATPILGAGINPNTGGTT